MPSIIIKDFHSGLNAVSQPSAKDASFADGMANCIASTRNAAQKRGGAVKINSSAFDSGAEILSIYDFERHEGGLQHLYLFNSTTKLSAMHLGSGTSGVIKAGLTSGAPMQYATAGRACYMGNGTDMLKLYALENYSLGGDQQVNLDATSPTRLAQSFSHDHGQDREIACITLPLIKTGTPPGNVYIEIRPDSGGVPHASTVTATSAQISGASLSASWEWVAFTFSTLPTLAASTEYWIVLRTTLAQTSGNVVGWAVDTDDGYASGSWATYTGSWTADATKDGLFSIYVVENWGIVEPSSGPTLDLSAVATQVSYTDTGSVDTNQDLTGAATGDLAQSFQLDEAAYIESVDVYMRKVGSPTGNISVRIETGGTGVPSGSLVGQASAQRAVSGVGASYAYEPFTFPASIRLEKDTPYWIVLQGDSTYDGSYVLNTTTIEWGVVAAGGYANGNFATWSTSWTAQASDGLFQVNTTSKWSAGGRRYRVSFKNSVTEHVSNAGPTTPASGNTESATISLDNFPTTGDEQVDEVVIWATTDGGSVWYYLDEIDYPASGPYVDDTSDDELNFGREAPFDNDPPVPANSTGGRIVERIRNSLVVAGVESDPRTAFYSGSLGQVLEGVPEESFPALNFQSVPSGAERIIAISQIDDLPVVFTPDQAFTIAGEDAESFRILQSRGGSIGTRSEKGAVATETGIFFLSTDKKVFLLPTVNAIPQVVSGIIEDELEDITGTGTVLNLVALEKARIEYLHFGDQRWIVLAIPTGTATTNTELWIYDLDLHDQHAGMGWMGPMTLAGAAPFQYLSVVTDEQHQKILLIGDDAGFIRRFPSGNQDDGVNITAVYRFPWMDGGMPQTVKDGLTVEVVVPAGQTVGATFLQVSYDTETNWQTITLYRVNELERGSSAHRYRGYLMRQFTRMKARINFAAEGASGELWQLQIDFHPLFDMAGAITHS